MVPATDLDGFNKRTVDTNHDAATGYMAHRKCDEPIGGSFYRHQTIYVQLVTNP